LIRGSIFFRKFATGHCYFLVFVETHCLVPLQFCNTIATAVPKIESSTLLLEMAGFEENMPKKIVFSQCGVF
jgi:hypothetical protein